MDISRENNSIESLCEVCCRFSKMLVVLIFFYFLRGTKNIFFVCGGGFFVLLLLFCWVVVWLVVFFSIRFLKTMTSLKIILNHQISVIIHYCKTIAE